MSEMLGNQYFLTRRYSEACFELEEEIQKNPLNKTVLKKLIICYLQTSQLEKAISFFGSLIYNDVYTILNTDHIKDDCPCPEIIYQMNNELPVFKTDEENIKLGILWLYCDIDESLKYFKMVSDRSKYSILVKRIVNKLEQVNKNLN